MVRFILQRLGQGAITVFLLITVVFVLSRFSGDPVLLLIGPGDTQADVERLRALYGLDKSIPEQFLVYLRGLAQGDLGQSIDSRLPVTEVIASRFPNTLQLGLGASIFGVGLAIPLGVLAAYYRGRRVDGFARFLALIGQSVPNFWLGLVLMFVFAVNLKVLPVGGKGGLTNYILPSITLGIFLLAALTRLIRSGMIEALQSDYVRFLRAKGLSERMVVWKHALRNSALASLSFFGVYLGLVVTGSVVVETVFSWPGVGRLAFQAISARDFPVVQGVVLFVGVGVILSSLLVDILYAFVDPRIRYGSTG